MDKETKRILENHEERIRKLEEFLPKKDLTEKPTRNLEERIKKISEEIGIETTSFYNLFFIDNEEILLLISPKGKNEAEKQFKATIVILTISDCLFGEDFIQSSSLNKKLRKLGIGSLVNLSTNLSKFKQFLIPRGRSKSKKFGFQITIPGKREGIRLIKEILENNGKG